MPLPRPSVPLFLLCATLSPGCAPSVPVLVPPVVPPGLLACQAQPPPPDAPDDSALALWILDLAAAGDDCRGRLARVKELLAHD